MAVELSHAAGPDATQAPLSEVKVARELVVAVDAREPVLAHAPHHRHARELEHPQRRARHAGAVEDEDQIGIGLLERLSGGAHRADGQPRGSQRVALRLADERERAQHARLGPRHVLLARAGREHRDLVPVAQRVDESRAAQLVAADRDRWIKIGIRRGCAGWPPAGSDVDRHCRPAPIHPWILGRHRSNIPRNGDLVYGVRGARERPVFGPRGGLRPSGAGDAFYRAGAHIRPDGGGAEGVPEDGPPAEQAGTHFFWLNSFVWSGEGRVSGSVDCE